MKEDPKIIEAISNLAPNADFRTFVKYLGNYEDMLTRTAIYANENADVYRGMARSMREVLKVVNKSSTF